MDQSQLKWIADFIWNIADDRLREVYGVLRREFIEGDMEHTNRLLSFDDVRQRAASEDAGWADRLSMRWTVSPQAAATIGGHHGQ